jgi:hypothetical protein
VTWGGGLRPALRQGYDGRRSPSGMMLGVQRIENGDGNGYDTKKQCPQCSFIGRRVAGGGRPRM